MNLGISCPQWKEDGHLLSNTCIQKHSFCQSPLGPEGDASENTWRARVPGLWTLSHETCHSRPGTWVSPCFSRDPVLTGNSQRTMVLYRQHIHHYPSTQNHLFFFTFRFHMKKNSFLRENILLTQIEHWRAVSGPGARPEFQLVSLLLSY